MSATTTGTLPNFLIIGAMKCGTTSLTEWLRVHPEVFIPREKELYYFNNPHRFAQGPDWYRAQFASGAGKTAIGEATAGYLGNPAVPGRIAALIPDVRMIAILRHPAERLYSQYLHLRAIGREKRTLARVVEEELGGTAPAFGFYVERGRYREHIRALHAVFPPENLKLALFDDLTSDPGSLFADICGFLGIDDTFRPDNLDKTHNPRKRVRSVRLWQALDTARLKRRIPWGLASRLENLIVRPDERPVEPMDPTLRARLVDHYADQVSALEALLNRDLSSWRV